MCGFTGDMVLPFEPLSVAFQDVQYFVDTPQVISLIDMLKEIKPRLPDCALGKFI